MMGIVSSLVTQLCTVPYIQDNSSDITVYYNIILAMATVIFTLSGYTFLFQKSKHGNIGSHDKGMGLVLAVISFPLIILEIVLVVAVFRNRSLSNILGVFLVVVVIEKIVQVLVYVLVRKCESRPRYNYGAIFYFSFLSFFNFTMWLNAIPFTDIKLYDEVSNGDVMWLVDRTFKALVIDYRLLCTLLFLEHALALSERDPNNDQHSTMVQIDQEFQPQRTRWRYTIGGICVGLFCLSLEIVNGVQFWCSVPDIVNLSPIVVDIILVASGYWLLNQAHINIFHNEKVTPVILMVTSMGAASITYLFIFCLLCITLIISSDDTLVEKKYSYVVWSAAVFFFRGASLFVLLLVYTGVPFRTMESSDNHRNIKNYGLTWVLFGGLLARFVGSILDEFHGTMHEIAHDHLESQHLRILKDLFNIGPLFQLATCLHLALHFLLMILRLYKPPRNVVDAQSTRDEQAAGQGSDEGESSGLAEHGEVDLSVDTAPLVGGMKVV